MSLFQSRFYSSTRTVLKHLSVYLKRPLSTTNIQNGLEEFFPPGVFEGEKYVEEETVVGRRWKASELRIRSNSDLHKFWFVLLKERNMLLTLEQECKRLGIPMPGPTRIHKVQLSMSVLQTVVRERNEAILMLETEKRYNFDAVDEKEKEEIALAAERKQPNLQKDILETEELSIKMS